MAIKSNIIVKAKTLHDNKAWVHEKYLVQARVNNVGLNIKHGKQEMKIPTEKIYPQYWTLSPREYSDVSTGKPYKIYGIHFVPSND